MMIKKRCLIILACLILSACLGLEAMAADDYAKNVEITKMTVNFSRTEFPPVAYLCLDLKNNGDKNVANLSLQVIYYDKEGYIIKKVALKNKLAEAIPPGEARRYKIRLNGDVFNERNEEYPYSQGEDVGEFDVKILNVKLARK